MRRKQLVRWVRDHGARFERHGAEHDMFKGPNGKQATIPRHREVNTNTARGICDQLGVPRPPWS